MTIAAIRNTIRLAIDHEQDTGHLATLFEEQFERIHMAIQLPDNDSVKELVEFVVAYIEQVPDFLEAAIDITRGARLDRQAQPIFKLAEDYFLKPPEIVRDHVGLDELMDEAYLAHRLMEEVNDRFMALVGVPLVPMDMTLSNLVVHNLIGEPFANELDKAVEAAVDRLMIKQFCGSDPFQAYLKARQQDHGQPALDSWPCLMEKLPINLQLAGWQQP